MSASKADALIAAYAQLCADLFLRGIIPKGHPDPELEALVTDLEFDNGSQDAQRSTHGPKDTRRTQRGRGTKAR